MINTFIEILSYDFFIRALVCGVLISGVLSFLSPFIVMKNQVIFGHTISHFAILGIMLGLFFDIPITIGIIISSVLASVIISILQEKKLFKNDSILSIIAQIGLAISVLWISIYDRYQINLEQFLFGDILSISSNDIILISVVTLVLIISISLLFKKLLSISLSEILSRISIKQYSYYIILFNILVAVGIAISIKILGILLVSAFITIPANSAKAFAKSLRQTFIFSTIIGISSTVIGLFLSTVLNTTSGPTIVIVLAVVWVGTFFMYRR